MTHPLLVAVGAVGGVFGVFACALGVAEPLRQDINYELFRHRPNSKLDPASMALALRRGYASEDVAHEDQLVQGFDEEHRRMLRKLTNQLSTAYEYIQAWRRGLYSKGIESGDLGDITNWGYPDVAPDMQKLLLQLYKIGFDYQHTQQLIAITEYIPTAQDVIAFAVREVYSPEIAEAFGQFQGVEAILDKAHDDIRASGMNPETFRKYWGAHWKLPSFDNGVEMLHRQIIDRTTLEKLMVALDIMPYWRDQLIKMTYLPYTRVDVRRMHKFGILSDEELVKSYQDLGYDDEKALRMAEFTIAYNKDPIEVEQTAPEKRTVYEQDLTKTDIINGYKDAILDPSEATEALVSIGYDQVEAEYYIAKVDYDKERDDTDTRLKYLHDSYIRNTLDFTETTIKLDEMNLSAKRKERLFEVWDLEKLAKTQKPTKAELLSWYKQKLLSESECRTELAGLGYAVKYIDKYIQGVPIATGESEAS